MLMPGLEPQSWRLFKDVLKADVAALKTGRKRTLFYAAALLGLNKFSAVLLHRVSHHCSRRGGVFGRIAAVVQRWNAIVNSVEIPATAAIGPGLRMPHPVGIVLAPISAGRNLTVLQNVTIGGREAGAQSDKYPIIEDDVTLSAGCVVIGAITIGAGASIGANAVVLHDVPPRSVAVGIPARVLPVREDRHAQGALTRL